MLKTVPTVVLLAVLAARQSGEPRRPAPVVLEEVTIAQLQQQMQAGRLTSRQVTDAYLDRIEMVDRHGPTLNAVIEINPDARSIADAMDRERRAAKVRGPLHGVPILIKDNIDTGDRMQTTAGSLALVQPSYFESFSMVLTEAWALRRPALVQGACAVLRGQAERSGGAIPYEGFAELEAAIDLLVADPSLRRAMGAAALAKAGSRSPEEIGRRWNDLLLELTAQR